MKRVSLLLVFAAMALVACGGSSGGGGGGGGDLADATNISITGTSTDANFATNGRFTVGFVAQDASGNPILASESVAAQVVEVKAYGKWKSTTTKDNGSVTATITMPASTTATLNTVTSISPSGGSGNVMGAPLIDDSGSMSSSDPANSRDPAADAFLDSVCASTSNMFGVFDFGAGSNLTFLNTRDLMTADGVTDAQLQGSNSALPYADCDPANVALAKTAITNQIIASGGTPLWESVLELCQDMVAKSASGEQLENRALAMLVLSDGEPNSDTDQAAAEACVRDNGITACTVGLGPGSELGSNGYSCTTDQECVDIFYGDKCSDNLCGYVASACTTDADCFGSSCLTGGFCATPGPAADPLAVAALKSLAQAGNCVYASATDTAALQPIFDAIGIAVSTGQNFALFELSPIPATGTTVEGTLTVGSATATFSFLAP